MKKKKKIIICVIAAFLVVCIGFGTIYIVGKANDDKSNVPEITTATVVELSDTSEKTTDEGKLEHEDNKTETVAQSHATTQEPAQPQQSNNTTQQPAQPQQSNTTTQQPAQPQQSNTTSQQPAQPQQSNTTTQQPAQTQQSNTTSQQPAQPQQSNTTSQQPAQPQQSNNATQEATTEETTTEHTPVWVVDEPAWDEVWDEYEDVEVVICNDCGADITSNVGAHFEDGADENGIFTCWGYHSEWKQVLVEHHVDHHEEIGHWE